MADLEYLKHVTYTLRSLSQRIQERKGDKKAKLTEAIGIISDLGILLVSAPPAVIRETQARLAGTRKTLRYGYAAEWRPRRMLEDDKHAEVFLAGALWAVDELFDARFRAIERIAERSHNSQRGALREFIVQHLAARPLATPGDLIREATEHGVPARPDQVSRALGDLLRDGLIEDADPPSDGDRRNRYVRLVEGSTVRDAAATEEADVTSQSLS